MVQQLLTQHYDPGYLLSTQRNFTRFDQARLLQPLDRSTASMDALANQLLENRAQVL